MMVIKFVSQEVSAINRLIIIYTDTQADGQTVSELSIINNM